MDSERQRRVEALYRAALQRDASSRDRFLEERCAGDQSLRLEVESLLRQDCSLIATRLDTEQSTDLPATRSVGTGDRALVQPRNVDAGDFRGTDRFAVIRRLGAGGMGVVYEVHDRARDDVVALKTLRHATPAGLYRLKQEFRSLAGMSHANVVCLYELVVDDDRCFFTMELVRGLNFVDYARTWPEGRLSIARLRSSLRQLIGGVLAVHRFGKLHRDIKPSNVLVTPEGRVVILDFGLMTELFPGSLGANDPAIGGTPAYLPPEQGTMPPSEAGDWYSVGVTLYAALTGELPFKGSLVEVLYRKSHFDPPPPAAIAPDVPPELSAVCMELMCRDPSSRLSGLDALHRLGWEPGVSTPYPTSEPGIDSPFVGRTRELALLDGAFRTVVDGRPVAMSVCGPSGIGKSALVRSFLDRLTSRHDVVVLSGRCYEHESVPYKAFDGVVDSLSRQLVSLPESLVESVLPRDVVALPRLFPVLLRVPTIAEACRDREPPTLEPLALRRRAFEALRDLLARLAVRVRLVISVDDLQWADLDGVRLLEELLRPPNAPALLAIVSFRSEEVAANPFLARLTQGGHEMWSALTVEPMPETEAGELIDALTSASLNDEQRRWITSEAGGNPFFLEQLARYVVTQPDHARTPTFTDMFDARVRGLPETARVFLHTLAVCGRPMASELVYNASGLACDERSLVASLRSAHFIRSSGSSERVEPYHDRIREALARQVSSSNTRRIHRQVADTLVARGIDDPEALFDHYRGAGDRERASIQAGRAGARASAALAFDRAALFYSHALDLNPGSSAALEWKEGYALALANAGRPAEAAEAYQRAAEGAGPRRRVELQQRGAEQFLIGGHIDRGLELIRVVFAGMGMKVPRSPRAALVAMAWQRARLRWHTLRFVSRHPDDIDADVLLRVDTCWSAVTGLLLVDMIPAGYFSARHLLMALEAGEPSRVARGMAVEAAANIAFPFGRKLARTLAERSSALAKSVGNSHTIALTILAEGMTAMMTGEWKKAWRCAEHALGVLREERAGVTWEVNIAQNLLIWALMYLGQLGEVSRLVPPLLANARSSGNLYIATELCTRSNYVWLVADDPDEGEREAIASIERWSHKGFHRQHYSALLARVQTALYRGDGEAAWKLFTEQESRLRRSLMTRIQLFRVESHYMRARSALAMAVQGGNHRRWLSIARAEARCIARERTPWSNPIAALLNAGIANMEGNSSLALGHLYDAADRFERADMSLYLAVARRRIGALQDDAIGRTVQRQADQWMAAQTIENPVCLTRMLAPGFPDV